MSIYEKLNIEEKESIRTLTVVVNNEPGTLARVIGLFSGRGYNIESLTVTEIDNKRSLSRISIVTKGTSNTIEQIKDKNEDQDFFSAIKICKKKRIGPSRQEDNRPLFYKKDIGVLARSGFDFEVSRRVMDLEKDEYLKIINLL